MNLVEIGHLIATARKKRKLTQGELAREAGIGRTTLSLIENGSINEIGINKIIALGELVLYPKKLDLEKIEYFSNIKSLFSLIFCSSLE